MMAQLLLSLLGGFRVERGDNSQPVSDWQRRSAKTLTKLLATSHGHVMHREQILEIIWPTADFDSALNSFGKALHAARRALQPDLTPRGSSPFLELRDTLLVLNTEHLVIDADRFEGMARAALRNKEISAYEAALAAYGGELLPEDRYASWCAERRHCLAELHIRLLLGLAEAFERRGHANDAADRLREVLRCDPAREAVHRWLMRIYAEMGIPDQAVRQFKLCKEALRQELDMAPEPETVALYNDVLAARIAPQGQSGTGRSRALPPCPAELCQTSAEPAPMALAAADLAVPGRGSPTPFVGRDRVMQRLAAIVASAEGAREPGLVVITGEAGVGKTRLLAEFAAEAHRHGTTVLTGGTGSPASHFVTGPFAIAIEGYVASLPTSEQGKVAQKYPPLARFAPSLRTGSVFTGRLGDQLDLIPSIVRFLADLADIRPLLLLLGDLHYADPMSLELVGYLAQLAPDRPWLLAASAREEDLSARIELRAMIEATMRARLCVKIELRGLSRPDCDALVRALLPEIDDFGDLAGQIYARSGGNPLFVRELAREIGQRSELPPRAMQRDDSGWVAGLLPRSMRERAASLLSAADQTLRRLIGLAAVAGETEIELATLRAAASELEPPVTDAALFDALDRALQLRLLEEGLTGYAFRDPLMRAAVYESLPRHRRDQLHAVLERSEMPRVVAAPGGLVAPARGAGGSAARGGRELESRSPTLTISDRLQAGRLTMPARARSAAAARSGKEGAHGGSGPHGRSRMSLARDLRPLSADSSPTPWSPTGRSTTTRLSNAPSRRAGATSMTSWLPRPWCTPRARYSPRQRQSATRASLPASAAGCGGFTWGELAAGMPVE
jgi:DNA-binding SARP family transcriptional activator